MLSGLYFFTDPHTLCSRYLCSVSVPAQVLGEAVEADVVGLTLRPCRAEGQAVAVLLHLLHLQGDTHRDITDAHPYL